MMQSNEEFLKELILLYFREHPKDYLFRDLIDCLGINKPILDELLEELMTQNYICYKDHFMQLTFDGRMALAKSNLEMHTSDENYDADIEESSLDDYLFFSPQFASRKRRSS